MQSIALIALGCLFAAGALPVTVDKKAVAASKTKGAPKKSSAASKTAAKSAPKTAAKSAPKAGSKTGATSSAKSSPKSNGKKSAPVAATHKSTSKTATTKNVSRKGGKKAPVQTWRARQQVPTPDRYRQIQEALAAKGYLKSEPSGVWNGESTEALRRFQADQKLEPSGKLNSLSLIALGLGPRRDTGTVPPPESHPESR